MRAARRSSLAAAGALLAVAALAGCKEVESESAEGYQPAKLDAVKGAKDDLQRVTFTAEGARRISLRTGVIGRSGTRRVLPYEALLYDEDGRPFVYAVRGTRSFVRENVRVERIEGGRVLLADGPAAGTRVVTVGAVEVYGAETEIAGGH